MPVHGVWTGNKSHFVRPLQPMTQGQTQAEDHPLVGQTVGKYKIVKLLGEGGMGCVYMAEQQLGTTARKVALKTLHKHLSHDPSIKARFDREAGTVAALEHPNTIQVYDFGQMDDGTLYLVMEYVQGKSVADILVQEGPMPPPRVDNIMRQVCGSLEEAHGHGIVHRDLKPDNVVLTERAGQKDWVEVLDFGIAKRSSEHDPNEAKLTQQGMVLGTPPYMSPEQFTGQPVDVRSDIYALGVMAYEMLTGKLPWEANTAWEWASKHMTEPPTPLERQPLGPHVPEAMRNAISRALAKNKEERFASVKDFYAAFSGGAAIPSVDAAIANAPVSNGGPPARAKTEMAQPMMGPPGGPPAAAVTPPYGGPGGPPPQAPVAIPAGPAHGGPQAAPKKGNTALIAGLGGLAALLLIGAGIAVVAGGKKKPVEPPPIETAATTSATPEGSVAATDTAAPAVTTAEPLTSAAPAVDPNAGKATSSSGGAAGGGTAKNPSGAKSTTPAPIPTPKPAQDTKECATYHAAKSAGQKPAILAALEAKCRASGGTP